MTCVRASHFFDLKKLFFLFVLSFFLCCAWGAEGAADSTYEKSPPKSSFSLDLDYLSVALSRNGWGLGVRYERYFGAHLAGRFCFGHSTFRLSSGADDLLEGVFVPTVAVFMFAEYFPFTKGLDGFYAAFGGGFDFIGVPDEYRIGTQTMYLSLYPLLGYKFDLSRYFSVDISAGYKKIFVDSAPELLPDYKEVFGGGLNIKFSFKIHFTEIFRRIF